MSTVTHVIASIINSAFSVLCFCIKKISFDFIRVTFMPGQKALFFVDKAYNYRCGRRANRVNFSQKLNQAGFNYILRNPQQRLRYLPGRVLHFAGYFHGYFSAYISFGRVGGNPTPQQRHFSQILRVLVSRISALRLSFRPGRSWR